MNPDSVVIAIVSDLYKRGFSGSAQDVITSYERIRGSLRHDMGLLDPFDPAHLRALAAPLSPEASEAVRAIEPEPEPTRDARMTEAFIDVDRWRRVAPAHYVGYGHSIHRDGPDNPSKRTWQVFNREGQIVATCRTAGDAKKKAIRRFQAASVVSRMSTMQGK